MDPLGGLSIWFKRSTSTIHYYLHLCKIYSPFPKKPPVKKNKVWIIEKRGLRTIVKCNEEKLLDFTASSKTCDYDKDPWKNFKGGKVKMFRFSRLHDTASELFYAGKYHVSSLSDVVIGWRVGVGGVGEKKKVYELRG